MEEKYRTVVIPTAGKGSRMGGETVKQCMEIGGKPLVAYVLEVFETSPVIDGIIFMTDVEHMEYVRTEIVEVYRLKKVSIIGIGGGERYGSVWKALYTLIEREEGERESTVRDKQDGHVLIHGGARPFVTGEIIERAYRAVCSYNACMVGIPVKDTIGLVNQEGMIEPSPDCNMVWQTQTPQVFSVPLIVEALARQIKAGCTGIADGAVVVEAQMGVKIQMVAGSYANIKVMTFEDLFMVEVLRNFAA